MTWQKKAINWFLALSKREKYLIASSGCAVLVFLVVYPALAFFDYLDAKQIETNQRMAALSQINALATRYKVLENRFAKLRNTFAEAEMSFELVYSSLDSIVKSSIGTSTYDLRKNREPSQIGLEYEKQDFQLTVQGLELEQVVRLLHQLEQGESPLFLRKVDILSRPQNKFDITLEIFSIRKSRA